MALWAWIPSARSRTCNWGECQLFQETAYEVFLTLWKDADSDVPILKSAKAEYAKL